MRELVQLKVLGSRALGFGYCRDKRDIINVSITETQIWGIFENWENRFFKGFFQKFSTLLFFMAPGYALDLNLPIQKFGYFSN